mgnify:CR=1 FL=1
MPLLCRFGAGHYQQVVRPAYLCHQWCHKFIACISFIKSYHTIQTTTIKSLDTRERFLNFIGKFDVPMSEPELTPEEAAALEKKRREREKQRERNRRYWAKKRGDANPGVSAKRQDSET